MLGALMALLPIQREGWLSDNEALRRFTRRPQTVGSSQGAPILGALYVTCSSHSLQG
jgi:hypothetical protein